MMWRHTPDEQEKGEGDRYGHGENKKEDGNVEVKGSRRAGGRAVDGSLFMSTKGNTGYHRDTGGKTTVFNSSRGSIPPDAPHALMENPSHSFPLSCTPGIADLSESQAFQGPHRPRKNHIRPPDGHSYVPSPAFSDPKHLRNEREARTMR
jgi:hypothetical protein